MPFGETIVALGTPVGESAIAGIRLSGPDALPLCESIFNKEKSIKERYAHFGKYRDLEGSILDEVIYIFYPEKSSYTGEAMLEIYTHGNPLIIKKIIKDCVMRGCRLAEPGEFTRTAFLSGKMDLSQAEAVAELIHAKSEKALQVAHNQLDGKLGERAKDFIDRLLQVVAEIEAYIDFPEEDLPPEASKRLQGQIRSLVIDIQLLIKTRRYGELLSSGIQTIIIGAPNAGKSSLLNALVGEDRAIVSETAGTTRDTIKEPIMIGSHCVQVIDTAGLHEAQSDIERMGIERTLKQAQKSDFFLVVLDSGAVLPSLPPVLSEFLCPENTLVVENKSDLEGSKDCSEFLPDVTHCRISLVEEKGIDLMRERMESLFEQMGGTTEDGLVVNARHVGALERAEKALEKASLELEELPKDLIASDLRGVVSAFEEIVGKVDNEEMLDRLFGTFCIGK